MTGTRRSGGRPQHLGVLVPWANAVVEAELHRITGTDLTWHYSRLVPPSRTTGLDERFLTGLLSAVPDALAQLVALPLQRAYLACTSAAFMYPELASQSGEGAPAGVDLVSAFDAIMAALSELSASCVVLLTPYPERVTAAEAAMFSASGVSVTAWSCLDTDDGYDTITPRQVKGLIRNVGRAAIDEADAVVLSCTGWPTFDLIPELQKSLEKPVISSNQAIGLHALREKEAHAR
jgi:maleate isomerase